MLQMMHMESLDRVFSGPTDVPVDGYQYDCSDQYSPIQYDGYALRPTEYHHSPLSHCSSTDSTPTTHSDDPLLSCSQSSGLSEIDSLSSLSISSSSNSCLSNSYNSNPFSTTPDSCRGKRGRKRSENITRKTSTNNNSSLVLDNVSRRSSAPVYNSNSSTTSSTNIPYQKNSTASRKDSFVYDVQLESDNVLLFVPDLDLVKSHLMFAVREEVDVLKERIGELSERITHLEYENTVLRKYASPEVLQQLQNETDSTGNNN